ncbi:MAG: ATP synthase F1 subunit epsilon [Myxococcota bacterium]
MSVQITIVTPSQLAFNDTADEVQIPGFAGEFGVLPSHASLLTLARPGVVTIHTGGAQRRFLVGRGVAEVGEGQVTLLVDLFETPDSIDRNAAKAELNQAWADLKSTAPGTPERATVENQIALLQARINA